MPLFKRKLKFDLAKFSSCLRMAEIRTRQCKNKTDNGIPLQIRDIEADLRKKNIEDAQIKAEVLIKSERLSAALDELDCILIEVIEKANLIIDPTSIPNDFLETLSALLYAVPRIDVKELDDVKKYLELKLGKEFVKGAMKGVRVDPLIVEKFRLDVPPPVLVGDYLESISAASRQRQTEINLPSVPTKKISARDDALKFPEIPKHAIKVDKSIRMEEYEDCLSNKDEKEERISKDEPKNELPSFEELSRRFDELKQIK